MTQDESPAIIVTMDATTPQPGSITGPAAPAGGVPSLSAGDVAPNASPAARKPTGLHELLLLGVIALGAELQHFATAGRCCRRHGSNIDRAVAASMEGLKAVHRA